MLGNITATNVPRTKINKQYYCKFSVGISDDTFQLKKSITGKYGGYDSVTSSVCILTNAAAETRLSLL